MLEIFLHGQWALYISIAITVLFLIVVGVLVGTDKESDFFECIAPALIGGLLIFGLWQGIILFIGALCILLIPIYIGVLIGRLLIIKQIKSKNNGPFSQLDKNFKNPNLLNY